MNLTPDGLALGPLALSWQNLTLILASLTWAWLARFPQAGAALGITLLTARIWSAWSGLSTERPALENILDIVDIRRGNWAWGAGLGAGLAYLLFQVWRQRLTVSPFLRPLLMALVVGLLPVGLRPAVVSDQVPFTALETITAQQTVNANPLPQPTVLNFWATWCGPCRAELPLLAHELKSGAKITLINVGEPPMAVQSFLLKHSPELQTRVGGEGLAAQLRVTAFPTTIVVNREGQVIARHLGPLSAAQLKRLIRLADSPADSDKDSS